MTPPDYKEYLGDSVYVAYEDGMFKLTTENGIGPSNEIYLEWQTYKALAEYVRLMDEIIENQSKDLPAF